MVLVLPLLLGNVFQASYNLVDTMIVGRFVGPEALAGVGRWLRRLSILSMRCSLGFLWGLPLWYPSCSALAGKRNCLWRCPPWCGRLWSWLLCSPLWGQLLVEPFLTVLRTPIEDYAFAEVYLRTILCGLVCNVFYNQLSGLLRGLGNTQMPLYILIFSCCVNAGLDLMFVCVFSLGVMGAGFATIFAEGAGRSADGPVYPKRRCRSCDFVVRGAVTVGCFPLFFASDCLWDCSRPVFPSAMY